MASYYYLMASLPMLKAGDKPSIDYNRFLSMCRSQVSDGVYSALESLDISKPSAGRISPVVDRWMEFNSSLLGEIAAARARNLGRTEKVPFDRTLESSALAAKVLAKDNPLEAEMTLIEGQFAFVDGLCGLHSFDEWSLFGYALKLRILERKSVFTQKAGKDEFDRLFSQIRDRIERI